VVLIYITLLLFGIKYALLISVMAAILNIIPYFGIYLSAAIGMIITLASGSGEQAVTLAIVFLVAHFLDANIILPRIVGGQVKMNPFITILAVLVGHLVWGIPGMFLFIPLTAIIRLISEEVPAMKPWTILLSEEKRLKILPMAPQPPDTGS
jgi:AI-2 transport protein TqsA